MHEQKTISEKSAEYLGKLVLHPLVKDYLFRLFKLYFRLETEGLENLPQNHGALIIPNHSGFAGLDAIILTHEIAEKLKRPPKVMTHHIWFLSQATAIPAQKLGFIEATTSNGLKLLRDGELVILFPEGEKGNFKPTSQKYQLQEFKRGFVRWAIEAQMPIIPTLIIGAEESQINLKRLELPFLLKKLMLPLPINLIPLPSRWKIVFLPPIYLPYHPNAALDNDLVHEITSDIQDKMQIALNFRIQNRKSIYL
jgi:1-acyl-sn-glycerol-3-phosphate acyltransferase